MSNRLLNHATQQDQTLHEGVKTPGKINRKFFESDLQNNSEKFTVISKRHLANVISTECRLWPASIVTPQRAFYHLDFNQMNCILAKLL